MVKKTVNIEIKTEDIKDILLTKMDQTNPHVFLIVNTIIDNLMITPKGLSQVLMAFNGIRPTTPFRVDDEVLIRIADISTWNRDKMRMDQQGLVFQGYIKAKIININLQKLLPISVTYPGYDGGGLWKPDFEEDFKEDQLIKGENGLLE